MRDVIKREPTRGEDGLKSLVKVVQILECFSTTDRALTLAEICRKVGFPKSTAHRLLGAMRGAGLLDQDSGRERYRLGLRLFQFGNIALANMELHREARPFVDALAHLSGQGVHLAVFDGSRAVVIHRGEPAPGAGAVPAFVESAPVHCTGVGKAILAFQPESVLERIVACGLARYTEATITEPDRLRAALATVRETGYAVDEAEHQPGLFCVGAPIRDATGRVFAAVSVHGPRFGMLAGEIGTVAELVMHNANAISVSLGARG
jgi:IclR family transcriptional regulator, KDG regulon repressor